MTKFKFCLSLVPEIHDLCSVSLLSYIYNMSLRAISQIHTDGYNVTLVLLFNVMIFTPVYS